jgi:hypothetical protein
MSSEAIIITGMHRSGTSLMAEYLNRCGLFVGSDLVNLAGSNEASAYNGHHEDRAFLDLHDQVLKRLHMSPFPTYRFRLPKKFSKKEQQLAHSLVRQRKQLSRWGWKDPRTALFLQPWHQIVPEAKHLLLFRNPLSVVDSLLRRATDNQILKRPVVGLKSWGIYNKQILSFWRKHPSSCLVCDIDELIDQPESICALVETHLHLSLNPVPFETVFKRKGFRPELSEAVDVLRSDYQKEISKALALYGDLQMAARGYR